ncbi:Integral membrane protein OS=Streptomyces alboniger OX=132473 GN=CP975_24565 PE=4 SV=1 [Streptomyces alboniger]
MIVALIIICEVGFWVLLAAGLALRYWARMPRTSVAVLLCEPLLEVLLFVVTAIDLRNGAEPDWRHGLAAAYIGYSVALGHYTIKWIDVRVAHRFAGGPAPTTPKYGTARAVHEWKLAARWVLAALIAMALLQGAVWYVGGEGETGSLRMWQQRMLWVIGINVVIAATYTLFPKKAPAAAEPDGEREKAQSRL